MTFLAPLAAAALTAPLHVPAASPESRASTRTRSWSSTRAGRVVWFPAGSGPIVVLPVGGHVWLTHTYDSDVWRL